MDLPPWGHGSQRSSASILFMTLVTCTDERLEIVLTTGESLEIATLHVTFLHASKWSIEPLATCIVCGPPEIAVDNYLSKYCNYSSQSAEGQLLRQATQPLFCGSVVSRCCICCSHGDHSGRWRETETETFHIGLYILYISYIYIYIYTYIYIYIIHFIYIHTRCKYKEEFDALQKHLDLWPGFGRAKN